LKERLVFTRKELQLMSQVTRIQLMPGVRLTAVHTKKFKSSVLSAQLLTPMDRETASCNALVPMVLRRGTQRYPNMTALTAALDELYGGSLEPVVRKKGETQCVGFLGSFLDDAYAPEGSRILEHAARLLGELLLCPAARNGRFLPQYAEREQAELIERLRAEKNDKRQYAMLRLIQEMCAGEPYGVDRLGDEAHAAAITEEALWTRYCRLLSQSLLELYYCGSAEAEQAADILCGVFAGLPRAEHLDEPVCSVMPDAAQDEPRLVEETMDVTQGKLVLGFRTGGSCIWEKEYPALMVLTAAYGGTTTSKLFLNVREKLSLCYYAGAQMEKFKGLVLVSSGVEFRNFEKAKNEILAQLELCRQGSIEDWELTAAKKSVVSSLLATPDAQSRLEDFWLGQAVADLDETPEELAARVDAVTASQVADAAKKLQLDTIYFLKGKEDTVRDR